MYCRNLSIFQLLFAVSIALCAVFVRATDADTAKEDLACRSLHEEVLKRGSSEEKYNYKRQGAFSEELERLNAARRSYLSQESNRIAKFAKRQLNATTTTATTTTVAASTSSVVTSSSDIVTTTSDGSDSSTSGSPIPNNATTTTSASSTSFTTSTSFTPSSSFFFGNSSTTSSTPSSTALTRTSVETTAKSTYTLEQTSTYTLPGGQRSTVTEITVIVPTEPSSPEGANSGSQTSGSPALHTNAASANQALQQSSFLATLGLLFYIGVNAV